MPVRALAPILAAYLVMSVATFAIFAADKRAAVRRRRRVPERTLHALSLLCGWPGALAAMQAVRHKRRKRRFVAVTWTIVAAHLAGWLWWASRLVPTGG